MRNLLFITILACSPLLLSACVESRPVPATQLPNGTQTVSIQVKNGYHPSLIEAELNKPLILKFFRDEAPGVHSCDQELSIPSQKLKQPLPAQKEVSITIPPQTSGTEVAFECGMKMMKGKIHFGAEP